MTTLRESGARVDSIAVDAHLGYYFQRTVIARLQADVLQPARQQGYRRIVLVGVSLGGLGALLCERDLPGSVDALVLAALASSCDQSAAPGRAPSRRSRTQPFSSTTFMPAGLFSCGLLNEPAGTSAARAQAVPP